MIINDKWRLYLEFVVESVLEDAGQQELLVHHLQQGAHYFICSRP